MASETSPKQITAVLPHTKVPCTGINLHAIMARERKDAAGSRGEAATRPYAIVAGERKDAAWVSSCLSLLKSGICHKLSV